MSKSHLSVILGLALANCIVRAQALQIPSATISGPGVLIEEVHPGSSLWKSGMKPGDIVIGWTRQASSGGDSRWHGGEIATVFDWLWVELEQLPRGGLHLEVIREGERMEMVVAPGWWQARVRPRVSLELETEVRKLVIDEVGPERVRRGALGAVLEQIEDPVIRSWIRWLVTADLSEAGDLSSCIDILGEGLSEAKPGAEAGFFWWRIGEAQRKLPYPGRARRSFLLAGKEWARLEPDDLTRAKVVNGLGVIDHIEGNLTKAAESYGEALLRRRNHAPESLDTAMSLTNRGLTLYGLGRLEEAESEIGEALRIASAISTESLPIARILSNAALIDWHRGDLRLAVERLLGSLEIQERFGAEASDIGSTLHFLASVNWELGDLDSSKFYFERARKILEVVEPHSYKMAGVYSGLAGLAQRRFEYAKSKKYEEMALEVGKFINPKSPEMARNLGNLASIAMDQGELEEAGQLILKALETSRSVSEEGDIHRAHLYSVAASIEFARQNWGRAAYWQKRALDERRSRAGGSLDVAKSLQRLGITQWKSGHHSAAKDYLEQALEIRQALTPYQADLAFNYYWLAVMAENGQPSDQIEALGLYDKAIEIFERQLEIFGGTSSDRRAYWAQTQDVFKSAIRLLVRTRNLERAFSVNEQWKARILREQVAERELDLMLKVPRDLLSARAELSRQLDVQSALIRGLDYEAEKERLPAEREKLENLLDRVDDIEEEIGSRAPDLGNSRSRRYSEVEDTRRALDAGTHLLSFNVGKSSTILFSTSKDWPLEVIEIDISEEALIRAVARFREKIQSEPYSRGQRSSSDQASRDLCELLVEPVASRIATSERLLILPDGPLHYLPWSAIFCHTKTPEGGRYLVEWKPIHLEISAMVYGDLVGRRSSPSSTPEAGWALVAIGDPDYPEPGALRQNNSPVIHSLAERGAIHFKKLPSTRREVEFIESLYKGEKTRILLGPEATEEAFYTLGGRIGILHLAVHGHADDLFPMSSFLAFSIPETFENDRPNGLLQAWEIYEKSRFSADLVVLSACETALGAEGAGEGIIGLARAFQYAGAQSVVASLWKVDDKGTARFMERFYLHLRSGQGKDEALRSAQLDLISGHFPDEDGLAAPYYWAGFQLYGDWK